MNLFRVETYAVKFKWDKDEWQFRHNIKDSNYYPSITEASEVLLEKNVDMIIKILTLKTLSDVDLKTGEISDVAEFRKREKYV